MNEAFRTEAFNADFSAQYRWYLEQAGEEIAGRFKDAVVITLRALVNRPDLGRLRKFRQPALQGLRSIQVKRPFDRVLVFYRIETSGITAWRLIDGARDLPRRLAEPHSLE